MPLITPAFPAMNSAFNVGVPQLRRLTEEFKRGAEVTNGWVGGGRGVEAWQELFELAPFFTRFHNFLQVDVWVGGWEEEEGKEKEAEEAFGRWFGWVESRLRTLIQALEQPPLMHCFPLADALPNPPTQKEEEEEEEKKGGGGVKRRVSFFTALMFDPTVSNYDVSPVVQDFMLKVRPFIFTYPPTHPPTSLLFPPIHPPIHQPTTYRSISGKRKPPPCTWASSTSRVGACLPAVLRGRRRIANPCLCLSMVVWRPRRRLLLGEEEEEEEEGMVVVVVEEEEEGNGNGWEDRSSSPTPTHLPPSNSGWEEAEEEEDRSLDWTCRRSPTINSSSGCRCPFLLLFN